MTSQQVFDTVVKHLREQGERAFDPVANKCRYRYTKPDGKVLKCAVGCLIPDEVYREEMEGVSVWALAYKGEYRDIGLPACLTEENALLFRLQFAHDNYFGDEDYLRNVAAEFGLVCS